jgi:signal transduction histidine kinase
MIRRISTKWVLAVLAAVLVPFLGFAWYVDVQLADRISHDIVRYYLLRQAAELADRIDGELLERRRDVELLASDPVVVFSAGGARPDGALPLLEPGLDRVVATSAGFDLLLVVDATGELVGASRVLRAGGERSPEEQARLATHDHGEEEWFRRALLGETWLVDQHASPLLHGEALAAGELDTKRPENLSVGIAAPVRAADGRVVGVVYGLLSWTVIQVDLLDGYRRARGFEGIGAEIYASSYSWLWASDSATIIGHLRRDLYGQRVDLPPVDLPQLVEAARSSDWGMYPEYEFLGQRKQAAYRHCRDREEGGLGWVVGLGIDNVDIYATVNELNALLVRATLLVLGIALVLTVYVARRTTRPIVALREHTQRVAAGDLAARIEVDRGDELGELAAAFNRMTGELAENRARLVQAEKESAWSEMARQVAHEIKNPLTPISLSVNLLRRARAEGSPEAEGILERTLDLVERQVENLRQIADGFQAFAGKRRLEPVDTDLKGLVEEVLELERAWAEDLGVTMRVDGESERAVLDPTELRRVLINLVTNALQAMPEGGELVVTIRGEPDAVGLEVRDSGVGLDEEVRRRLFEPYFTTRSAGTGLGLAICKRVVEELGGEIRLEGVPPDEGGGTRALLRLPRRPPGDAHPG